MRVLLGVSLASCIALAGCIPGERPALNPPALVGEQQTDLALQMFMTTTVELAVAWGFSPRPEFVERTIPSGATQARNRIPFLVPIREEISYDLKAKAGTFDFTQASSDKIKNLTKAYIIHGAEAAQIICRNYMFGLSERNRYYEFLQKELNVGFGLANLALALSGANLTLTQVFAGAQTFTNQGLDTYQEFRYLTIDHEAARILVLKAQSKLTEHYLKQVTDGHLSSFPSAISAVAEIEYFCTRPGLKYLLNQSVNSAPYALTVDNGILKIGD